MSRRTTPSPPRTGSRSPPRSGARDLKHQHSTAHATPREWNKSRGDTASSFDAMFGGFSDPPPPVRTPATDTPLPPADAPATDDLMLSQPPPHGPPHQPKPPSHPPPADAKRPSLLGNLRGAARKVRASHLLADEGKKRQSRARGRPPRPPPEGGINATLVLCTTLSAPYESGIEYKSLPLPEGQTLELDGRGEIVIPEGEMQVHLAHPRLGPLRSYMLAYGPLPALPPVAHVGR